MDNYSLNLNKLKKINFFTSSVKKYDGDSDNSNEVIELANIASGDFGIRGKISDIQRFLDDDKAFGRFSFDLKDLKKFNIDDEIVDIDERGRVKVYLNVDFRWEINVGELKMLSKEYHLDFWSLVFDTAVAFIHEACIVDGEVVYELAQEYETWDGEW